MSPLRFVLDENVARPIAQALRERGHDAESARDLGRLRWTDVRVLTHASQAGQTVVTHNARDFWMLQEAWIGWRRRWSGEAERATGKVVPMSGHAGIVIVPQVPVADVEALVASFAERHGAIPDRIFVWSGDGGWSELLRQPDGRF